VIASRCTRVSDKPLQCLRSNGASRYGITIRRPYALPDDIASHPQASAFGCWQRNGINLAMLSTARHENSPPPAQ